MTAATPAQRKATERQRKAEASRKRVDVDLPAWLVAWIDAQPGTRAGVIEAALMRAHKIKQPKE